jgi:hypothetical protein
MARIVFGALVGLFIGAIIGLASVGVVALYLNSFRGPRTIPCEVLNEEVMLHGVELIRVPGTSEPIPMSGPLQFYALIECNGLKFLIHHDDWNGEK